MKLALIGSDDESVALAHWAIEHGHQLVAAYDVGSRADKVRTIAPNVRIGDDWESLVLGTQVDGVIIGRGMAGTSASTGIADDERRAEQLRKLAQAAIPMLIVHPACEAIIGFEIEMIRRDSKAAIVPYVAGAREPEFLQLIGLLGWGPKSKVGAIEQIVFERSILDRSRSQVLTQFSRDAALIQRMIEKIRSVTASEPGLPQGRDPLGPRPEKLPSFANLSVFVNGNEGLAVRWSILPAHRQESGTITVIGEAGRIVLEMPEGQDWKLQIDSLSTDDVRQDSEQRSWPDEFENVFFDFTHAISDPGAISEESAWLDACRAQEAAEAIDRSLLRGRTIELFGEDHTEEESFKGVMAMGGCLLLVMALAVLFVATIVEGLRLPLRDWAVWKFWPVYLLLPIGVFLLLQLLQLAIKRENVPTVDQLAGTSAGGK